MEELGAYRPLLSLSTTDLLVCPIGELNCSYSFNGPYINALQQPHQISPHLISYTLNAFTSDIWYFCMLGFSWTAWAEALDRHRTQCLKVRATNTLLSVVLQGTQSLLYSSAKSTNCKLAPCRDFDSNCLV